MVEVAALAARNVGNQSVEDDSIGVVAVQALVQEVAQYATALRSTVGRPHGRAHPEATEIRRTAGTTSRHAAKATPDQRPVRIGFGRPACSNVRP